MALSAQINLLLMAHETSSGDLSRTLRATPASYSLAIADGTGDNQAQVVWSASRTATTSNDDLMLSALADTRDGAAFTVTFTQIKVVYVRNTSSTQNLKIGGASGVGVFAGMPISVVLTIPPGGCYLFSVPSAGGVAASAGISVARFAAEAGTCTYDVVLIGEGTVA